VKTPVEIITRVALTVFLSIGLPLAASYVWEGKIAPIDQVFLGILTFVVASVVQIATQLNTLTSTAVEQRKLWEIKNDGDAALSNVRKHYFDISADNVLAQSYFEQKIDELNRSLTDAALRGIIQVSQNADTTSMMLSPFSGRMDDIVRAVHFLTDNEFLFDVHASHFFGAVASMVANGRIREVKRLVVLDAEDQLQDARTQRLLRFHRSTANFDYRIIRRADYARVMRDFPLPADTRDFGVYGSRFVYKSQTNTKDDVRGVFLFDNIEVDRFINFFERCWTHRVVFTLPGAQEAISIEELFGDDQVSPNRPGFQREVIK